MTPRTRRAPLPFSAPPMPRLKRPPPPRSDAAAQRIQAALDRAAAARAEAGAPTPPPQEQKDGGSPHLQHHDFHSAMMLHEAAAVLNLHAQAVSIQNIRSLITTVLDVNSGNYVKGMSLCTCGLCGAVLVVLCGAAASHFLQHTLAPLLL